MLSLIEEKRKRLFAIRPRLEENSESKEEDERMAPQPEMEQIQPPPPAAAAEKMAWQQHAKDVAWMGPPPPAEEPMATELPAGDEIEFIESASARTETIRSETLSTVSMQPAAPNPAYATKTSKNKRRGVAEWLERRIWIP